MMTSRLTLSLEVLFQEPCGYQNPQMLDSSISEALSIFEGDGAVAAAHSRWLSEAGSGHG